MLAHMTRNQVEAAYNRTEYRERKHELALKWADMLRVASLLNDTAQIIRVLNFQYDFTYCMIWGVD